MRKITIFLVCLLLLGGCKSDGTTSDNNVKYFNYIDLIINNNYVVSSNIPFDCSISVGKNEKEEYVYLVTIENPKIAMYNVEMMALINTDIGKDTMFPTVGVIDDDRYSMIPFQSNLERGFPGAIIVSGTSEVPEFTVNLLVVYHDYSGQNETKVFLNLDGKYVEETKKDESVASEESTPAKTNSDEEE